MSGNRMQSIVIATDFSRYPEDGPFSGAKFRQDHLAPALQDFDRVEVIFDGAAGFGSSFLEEAFGGCQSSDTYRTGHAIRSDNDQQKGTGLPTRSCWRTKWRPAMQAIRHGRRFA